MARGVAHDEKTKQAVKAALLTGQSAAQVAREFGLDKSIVSRWKAEIPPPALQQVATRKAETLETLLAGYVEANLRALTAQAGVASDETYLRQFPPQQLAVLHGVMADKAARILEFAARAGGRAPGEEDGSGEEEGEEERRAPKILVEYFDDTTSTSAHGAGEDQG